MVDKEEDSISSTVGSYYERTTPKIIEVDGKLIHLDTLFTSSERGILKVLEIALCFLCIILASASQPVENERGIALLVCSIGIIFSFTLLIAFILMLNTKIPSTIWFVGEVAYYVTMSIGLFVSGVVMAIFGAMHWADINPEWQTLPALTAAALFTCMIIYLVDLGLLICHWKRYSWRPSNDFDEPADTTVLPY